jgi:hypothetical protein
VVTYGRGTCAIRSADSGYASDGASFSQRIVRPPLRRREAYRRSFGRTHPAGRCDQLAGVRNHVGLAPRVGYQQLDLFINGSGLDWPPARKQIHRLSIEAPLRRWRIIPRVTRGHRSDMAANLFRESVEGELWLSGAPRIAQRGQPPQGVAAIDPVMHQEASEEGVHLCAPGRRETGKRSSCG